MSIKEIQKQSLKDKIKSLMNRNKQLDTQLKQTSSEQQKEQIEQEQSANTNELRKSRTQKYELEQVKEDIDYIKRAYSKSSLALSFKDDLNLPLKPLPLVVGYLFSKNVSKILLIVFNIDTAIS